jgi:hypothetical protein
MPTFFVQKQQGQYCVCARPCDVLKSEESCTVFDCKDDQQHAEELCAQLNDVIDSPRGTPS